MTFVSSKHHDVRICINLIGEFNPLSLYFLNTLLPNQLQEEYHIYVCTYNWSNYPLIRNLYHETYITEPCPDAIVTSSAENIQEWNTTECIRRCFKNHSVVCRYDYIVILPFSEIFIDPLSYFPSTVIHSCSISDTLIRSILSELGQYANQSLSIVGKPVVNLSPYVHQNMYTETRFNLLPFVSNNLFIAEEFTPSVIENFRPIQSHTAVICVPSAIHLKNPSRSVFSREERFKQTVRQGKTIRAKYPSSVSVLCEVSSVLSLNELKELSAVYSCVVLYAHDEQCQFYAHIDPNKNKTEVYILQHMFSVFMKTSCSYIAKFGGRYQFSPSHSQDLKLFDSNCAVMKMVRAEYYQQKYMIEPVFYSIPRRYFSAYLKCLQQMSGILCNQFTDVERLMYSLFFTRDDIDVVSPEKMEIMGYGATNGVFRYF